MTPTLLLFLAVGLSMDAFAVSIANGLTYRMSPWRNALYSGLAFGLFQMFMPLAGFFAGNALRHIIEDWDHWIALALLTFIGGKMVLEAWKEMREPDEAAGLRNFSFGLLLVQAVATSIDALAVGVGLGVMRVNIWLSVACIGAVTFAFSFSGVLLGRRFGALLGRRAELAGGIILILIGVRIFVEHVFSI